MAIAIQGFDKQCHSRRQRFDIATELRGRGRSHPRDHEMLMEIAYLIHRFFNQGNDMLDVQVMRLQQLLDLLFREIL